MKIILFPLCDSMICIAVRRKNYLQILAAFRRGLPGVNVHERVSRPIMRPTRMRRAMCVRAKRCCERPAHDLRAALVRRHVLLTLFNRVFFQARIFNFRDRNSA